MASMPMAIIKTSKKNGSSVQLEEEPQAEDLGNAQSHSIRCPSLHLAAMVYSKYRKRHRLVLLRHS